jgi:proline iminopeptidase
VLYDQRGAGNSRPYASTEHNDTQLLIEDQRQLLNHLRIEKAIFLGGSWGSTLGLAYAIAHPDTVAGLILRGIWLGTHEENQHMYSGGTRAIFPEAFQRYSEQVPIGWRANPLTYYYAILKAGELDTDELRRTLAYELTRYEMAMMRLVPLSEDELHEKAASSSFESIAALEAHYIVNDCFLNHRHILRNAALVPDVPIRIINGRYDAMCPPIAAYKLYEALRGRRDVQLDIVVAGHEGSEPEIMESLLRATYEIAETLLR